MSHAHVKPELPFARVGQLLEARLGRPIAQFDVRLLRLEET